MIYISKFIDVLNRTQIHNITPRIRRARGWLLFAFGINRLLVSNNGNVGESALIEMTMNDMMPMTDVQQSTLMLPTHISRTTWCRKINCIACEQALEPSLIVGNHFNRRPILAATLADHPALM